MIRIMTYNIRGGLGMDKRRSIARVADVIRSSGADIVCLQEVHQRLPWSRMLDQPKWLGERLGMRFAFQRNISFGVGGFGNALLTKFDILATRSHRLTSKGEHRGLLEVRITTPDGPLTVFCTHLGLDSDERVIQAREVAAVVNASPGPKIVCGDVNEDVDRPAVASLVASAGLRDPATGVPATYSSETPSHRIDVILCDPSIKTSSMTVLSTLASDHLPVVADILLSGTKDQDEQQDNHDRMDDE